MHRYTITSPVQLCLQADHHLPTAWTVALWPFLRTVVYTSSPDADLILDSSLFLLVLDCRQQNLERQSAERFSSIITSGVAENRKRTVARSRELSHEFASTFIHNESGELHDTGVNPAMCLDCCYLPCKVDDSSSEYRA